METPFLAYILVLLLGLGAGVLLLRFPGLTEKIRETIAKRGDPQYFMAGVLVLLTVTIFLLDERPVEMPVGAVKEATTTIESRLVGKSSEEKASLKGQEIAKIATTFKERAQHGKADYEIEIQDINAIDGGVEVFARAWTPEGDPVGFGVDGTVEIERFIIYNPPILVPDPQGSVVVTEENPRAGTTTEHRYREDTKQALLQTLAHTVSVVAKDGKNIVPGKRGNSTSTFYPNAHPETSSVDGRADRGGVNESWASIRGGAGNGHQDATAVTDMTWMFMTSSANQFGTLERAIYLFDTSPIPDSDPINSVTLSVYGSAKDDPSGVSPAVNVTASNPISGNTDLVNGDYSAVSDTAFSTAISYASFSTSGYNNFALNASGLAAVTTTGVSKFAIRLVFDINNTAPTHTPSTWFGFSGYYADQTGTTNDPKLVVEHGAVATGYEETTFFDL